MIGLYMQDTRGIYTKNIQRGHIESNIGIKGITT